MKKESQFRKKPNLYVSIEVKIKNGFISDVFLFLISWKLLKVIIVKAIT
jgi:hypothetical protein